MSTPNALLPPPPYNVPFVDKNGLLSFAWNKWIGQLYQRAGESDAPSNTQIVNNSSTITTIQGQITSLQSSVSSINTSINILNKDIFNLGVGRQL